MGNIFNDDFRDFIQALNDAEVEYMLVGGFSAILYGRNRTTGDMDIWVDRTLVNYNKLKSAFLQFGMPTFDMTEQAFLETDNIDVFTFGRPPAAIDIMIKVLGLKFEEAYRKSVIFDSDGLNVRTVHLDDLISAKKASGRYKDLDDIDHLNRDNNV